MKTKLILSILFLSLAAALQACAPIPPGMPSEIVISITISKEEIPPAEQASPPEEPSPSKEKEGLWR